MLMFNKIHGGIGVTARTGVHMVNGVRQRMDVSGRIGKKAGVGMVKVDGRRHGGKTMVGRTVTLKLQDVGGCALARHGHMDGRIQHQMWQRKQSKMVQEAHRTRLIQWKAICMIQITVTMQSS